MKFEVRPASERVVQHQYRHALDVARIAQRPNVNGLQAHRCYDLGDSRLRLATVSDQRYGNRPACAWRMVLLRFYE